MPAGCPLVARGVFFRERIYLQTQSFSALGLQNGPEAGSFTLVSPGFGPILQPHLHNNLQNVLTALLLVSPGFGPILQPHVFGKDLSF